MAGSQTAKTIFVKIVRVFFGVPWILVGIFCFISIFITPEVGDKLFLLVSSIGTIAAGYFIVFYKWRSIGAGYPSAVDKDRNLIALTDEQLHQIENDQLPVIDSQYLPILLQAGEVGHYITQASVSEEKRQVVGHTGGSAGFSFRVAKGVYFRTGESKSRAVYSNVTHAYPGNLIITNKRVIFLQTQKGFDIPIKGLTAVNPITDGVLIQYKGKAYTVLLPKPEYPWAVINRVFELQQINQ